MITIKEIEEKTMTPEKKRTARNDYFAFYIGRPLSYVLTIPFLYTSITPNTVSLISIIPLIIGFILMYISNNKTIYIVGWIMFFLWNLLDGVDGNIARYKNQSSKLGSVYDAMAGYVAMVFSFFSWGIAASHSPGAINKIIQLPLDLYIVIGALSGIFVIFPRFIMHKTISTVGDNKSIEAVKDKSEYGILKIIALNLISISGFVQVFMLIAIILNLFDLFTIIYFLLNFVVMLFSLKSIFKEE